MRELSCFETQYVNGAADLTLAMAAGVFAGGFAAWGVSKVPSLSTVAGTLALGGTGAFLGTLALPVVGTFFGACIGGLTGYALSSTFAPVITFCGVGGLATFAVAFS